MTEDVKIVKLSPSETEQAKAKPRGKHADVYNAMMGLQPGESLRLETPYPALQIMNSMWCRLHRNKIKGFTFRRIAENTLVIIRLGA